MANWLVGDGIECQSILPVGFGSTKPIIDPDKGSEANLNNRVELHNAALGGRAIGGMILDGGGKDIRDFANLPTKNKKGYVRKRNLYLWPLA